MLLRDDHRLRIGILFFPTTDSAVTISPGSAFQCGLDGAGVATHLPRDRKAWIRARERKLTLGVVTVIHRNRVSVVVLQSDGAAMDAMPSAAAYIFLVAHCSPFRPSSPQ